MDGDTVWVVALLVGYAGAFGVGFFIGWMSGRSDTTTNTNTTKQ